VIEPAAAPLPDPADVDPVVVARPEHFCEGPVLDGDGTLFVSSPPGGYVLKRRGGDWKIWTRARRANGHKILPDGDHLLCHGDHVLRLDAEGKLLGAAASGWVEGEGAGAPGHRIRWPNDITLDGDGGFYFTESIREEGAVIHVDAAGSARVVARDIDFANGLALTPDGRRLLVAESYRNRILVVCLDAPGVPAGPPTPFANLPSHPDPEGTAVPDGAAFDAAGRLWVAHYGMQALHVLAADGTLLATYDSGIPLTSNLCFAEGSIYVTGGAGTPGPGLLTRLAVGVPGA
jgi:gluconolactonase